MQLTIAEQPIERLEWCTHALGDRPGTCDVHQGQPAPNHQCSNDADQHALSTRVVDKCAFPTLLQYFRRTHANDSLLVWQPQGLSLRMRALLAEFSPLVDRQQNFVGNPQPPFRFAETG